MRELEKWAKDKNILIAIISICIAYSADSCFKFLKFFKAGEHIEGYHSPPKLKEWLELYKSHRKFDKYLRDTFSDFGELPKIIGEFSDQLDLNRKIRRKLGSNKFNKIFGKEIEQISSAEWEEIKKAIEEFWQKVYQLNLEDIEADIKGEVDEELAKKFRTELVKEPEMLFFIRVWAPCWLLYGQLPPTLLRSARTGNIDSLEKLLRLDESTINDSKIAEIYHQAKSKKNKTVYDLMTKSLNKSPRAKITLQKIKINFAGMISTISIYLCQRLTEPEIRALFDAIAHDTGKGDIDTDLPDSPESFSKAIQRERNAWRIFDKPGQKIIKFLSEYKSSCSVTSTKHEDIKYKKERSKTNIAKILLKVFCLTRKPLL